MNDSRRPRTDRIAAQYTARWFILGTAVPDEGAIDEVGIAIYARCESMLESTGITRSGRPVCPQCGAVLPARTYAVDEVYSCVNCSWSCPAANYQKTQSRKNLGTGGMGDEIRRFMREFESAPSYRRKAVLIDTLIHWFHWASAQSRPLATALIEGSMKSTMAFLDRITYGEEVPPEVRETREAWRSSWAQNAWSDGKGQ